jgi:hypothetical protein
MTAFKKQHIRHYIILNIIFTLYFKLKKNAAETMI